MTTGDFYIGYATGLPATSRRRIIRVVLAAIALGLAVAASVLASQSPLPATRFDYGRTDEFSGILRLDPEPTLVTTTGRLLLVAPGKRSAAPLVAAFANQTVRLAGALISRPGLSLIEVKPGSVTADAGTGRPPSAPDVLEDLGETTLTGEIVDAKCWAGVMNPGEGAVHRDCARACLRGGLPGRLIVRDRQGHEHLLSLESKDGAAIDRGLARLAGRPVTVTGRLLRSADRWIMRVDPASLR